MAVALGAAMLRGNATLIRLSSLQWKLVEQKKRCRDREALAPFTRSWFQSPGRRVDWILSWRRRGLVVHGNTTPTSGVDHHKHETNSLLLLLLLLWLRITD